MSGYLVNVSGLVPLVLDLRITQTTRNVGQVDPTLVLMDTFITLTIYSDMSINETYTDKIRKCRVDYNNNPPNVISFMFAITSTSGRIHSSIVYLLFLQVHRTTDRFFSAQLQEFSSCNIFVSSSTTTERRSPRSSNPRL